ncbi:hypothetical protein G9X68_06665 [Rhizobium sp. WYCCWR 11279]|nr:hypothetical protein [Rhizobium changzhiense]NNU46801.1 hypothetical protein [Rhizobium changzhiense]
MLDHASELAPIDTLSKADALSLWFDDLSNKIFPSRDEAKQAYPRDG